MIRILVFSDTHRRTDRMKNILRRKQGSVDLVIHLGDNFTDIKEIREEFPAIAFLGVKGNCDLFSDPDYPDQNSINLEGHRLFFTHGHTLNVRHSDELLVYAAHKAGAEIALYGHTHVGALYEKDGITVFNPGSLSEPRDGKNGSYGFITLDGDTLHLQHEYL